MSEIYVLAGVNGAGKSSVGGAMIQQAGVDFFNPDEAERDYREVEGLQASEANIAAWTLGKQFLEEAIANRATYAFETTLGGRTIASLLHTGARAGIHIVVWYVGLSSVPLHLARLELSTALQHLLCRTMLRSVMAQCA